MLWWTLGCTCLFQIWFPWCVCPEVGLLGHMAVLIPVFKEISTLFSIEAVLVCIPTNSVRGFPVLHTLHSIIACRLLDSSHPDWHVMVTITLYAKQKKRHRCTEQTFGLCGRRRGWDVSRDQHRNMYIIKGETDHQPRLDAWDKCLGLVHWEDPERSGREGGERWGSGWWIHVNPWLIHVNVWQKPLQYCKAISLQLIKIK